MLRHPRSAAQPSSHRTTSTEIVRGNVTGEDFADPVAAGSCPRIAARERGLITLLLHPGSVRFVAPAVIAIEEDTDRTVDILDTALGDVEATLD